MKKILLIIALIFLMALNVFAQTGSYTSHDIFYLPLYGAYGTDEYDQYNTYMEIADQLIWDNKTAIEAIEADYLVAADLTGYYTKLEIDAFGYITDAEAVTAIKADVDWNATEWDLAYGWGDHALEGYLTAETDPSFVDWSVSQAPTVIHADNYTDNDTTYTSSDFTHDDLTGVIANEHIDWTTDQGATNIHSGNYTDTDTTYTAGTGLDLTGTVFSLDASAFDLSDFPADPNDDRYLFWNDTTGAITWAEGSGSGVTTFVGLTDTPLNYTGYAGYFPKVNAGATALEFAELTEADISDLGTYLTDITSESFADLSDIPAHPGVATKILETTADGYQYIDTPSGGAGATAFTGLTDTPANYTDAAGKFVKVNSTPDGLEYASITESDITDLGTYLTDITGESLLDLTDTPVAFSSGKFLKSGADAVTFESITESDISDFGTYLTDITSESFADLSDIPAHPGVATKILETTADGYQYIDTPSGSGGEANTASNIGGQIEIFKQKEGVDLEFRTLRAGTGIDIYNSVPTGTWDITNCSYDSISKDVNSQESKPFGVAFNSDGSKMYIVGSKKTVYQYTLSTPWNVGTATYDTVSKSVSSQDGAPYDVAFNSDGSKMYIMGYNNKTVYQYTLSTPWNVSTATYDSISKDVSSQDGVPYDVAFNSDGSKMYIVGNSNDTVYQYTLSTPWNVGTATYDTVSKSVNSQESNPFGVAFNSDGSKMYIMGYSSKTVYQYTVGGTTEYDYVQIDLDLPNDTTKFLDGDGVWRVLVEADISDLGTYLTDITSESFADLSDIPAHPGVATKILETTADGYQYIDTPTGGGGMHITNDLSDGEYSGQTTIGKVGENVEFGDLLYFDFISKTWKLAKADSASTMPCTAIVLEEKDADEDCKILRNGYIMSGDWTFTDSIVYVSPTDEGDVIDSVPDQSGNQIQRIGIAEDDSLLWFSPSLDIGEVK